MIRVPIFPERCALQEQDISERAGGSALKRAPPAGRSHYCAAASSPRWRVGPPPSRPDKEATQSEETSSPGTETEKRKKEGVQCVLKV